jgi:uncharacterized protein (DUF433 family)
MTLPPVRVAHPHVEISPEISSGSPVIVGYRVPVRRIFAWHRRGVSVETLIKRYPNLGPARVLDALAFAYDNLDLIEADLAREKALISTGFPGQTKLTSPRDPQLPLVPTDGALKSR